MIDKKFSQNHNSDLESFKNLIFIGCDRSKFCLQPKFNIDGRSMKRLKRAPLVINVCFNFDSIPLVYYKLSSSEESILSVVPFVCLISAVKHNVTNFQII